MSVESGRDARPPVEVTEELREVFEPLCLAVAELSHPDAVSARSPELFEVVAGLSAYKLRHGDIYRRLPWDVAVGVDLAEVDAINAGRESEDSDRDTAAYQRMGLFLSDVMRRYESGGAESLALDPSYNAGVLRSSLSYCLFGPPGSFNAADWRAQERYLAQLTPEERATIKLAYDLRGFLGTNSSNRPTEDNQAMSEAGQFLLIKNTSVPTMKEFTHLMMPVGEYGEEFSQKVMAATAVTQIVADDVRGMAQIATAGHEATLHTYTARGSDGAEANSYTTMHTVQEGILSVMQAIAFLTAERVEGYEDPSALLHDLVRDGLIERLARYTPMGFIGPMTLTNQYVPGAIERTDRGLRFSNALEALLKERRSRYVTRVMLGEMNQNYGDYKSSGRICPVSGRDGGIHAVAASVAELISSPQLQAPQVV